MGKQNAAARGTEPTMHWNKDERGERWLSFTEWTLQFFKVRVVVREYKLI